MAGEIYLSGLGNDNFDYQSILQKYQELMSISIQKLQYDQQSLSQKKSAVSEIADQLKAFSDPVSALKSSLTYQTKVADLSNPNIADVSVTTDAVNASYTLTVSQLAKASSYKVGTVSTISDFNATLSGSGTLTINYLKDGTATSYSVDYTGKSLKDIMDDINNNSGDLQASIINLGTSSSPDYQLIITSKNTGTANAITGIDDSANPGDDSAGIFSENSTKTYETVAAQDAQININGIDFTSSTNTFENIITGVSITVNQIGTTDINISNDYQSIQDNIQKIVDTYNSLLDLVQNLTGKDQPLSGESTFLRMVSGIANTILDNLGQYGFIESGATGEHGKLSLDTTKFQEFMNRPDAQTILQDFATQLDTYVNNYIDTTDNISQGYDKQINYINDRIEFTQERINKQIEIMRQQFIKLEVYMSQMQEIQARLAGFTQNSGTSNSSG
ncbi:flagellar filament capping protein FliD [Hydrogenothermus marinus]|uniref:Flagellar hook-associated protein 2 n=1 Tax=Hydrogenothermus marinus TaxID=133270 RepID=A0A3M0BQQ4_9AQUI|nr:flagellar filament capping protein FliD [Hydrogenothermus marinus]RMA93252.1 flagellar hook-associated protein 2 [Hydrogenothermus marinus]